MTKQIGNNKKILKNTLMLYIRMLVLILVNLYTSRIVLNALGAEDFGLYSVVGSIVVFLGFFNTSMIAASQRFLSYSKGRGNKEEENSVFSSLCITHLIIAFVIFVIAETVGLFYINTFLKVDVSRMYAAHLVFQFSLGCLICKTITVPYNAAVISNEKMDAFALISIIEGGLQLLVAFVLPLIVADKLILYSGLMFAVVVLTQISYRIYSELNFPECKFRRNWERSKIKEIFIYSGWNLFGALSSVLISQGLNVVLNFYFGTVINAARGIATQVNGALASFTGNFQQSLRPQIVMNYAVEEYSKMHQFIINGSRFSFYLLLVLAIPFMYNMEEILSLWLVNVPEYTPWLCRLELIYALIGTLSGTILIGVMATKDIKKYQIVVGTINMLTLPIVVAVIQFYRNPYIASVIMCIISIFAFVARLAIAKEKIFLNPRDYMSSISKMVLPSLIVLIPLEYFVMDLLPIGGIVNLIVRVFVSFIICLFVICILGITSKERTNVFLFIRKRLHI